MLYQVFFKKNKNNRHVLILVNTAARLLFAQMWKNVEMPKLEVLIGKIYEMVEMDMLTEK